MYMYHSRPFHLKITSGEYILIVIFTIKFHYNPWGCYKHTEGQYYMLHCVIFKYILVTIKIAYCILILSHRGLGICAQWESCGLYRRIARQQLCEHLDCTTVSTGHLTSAFPQVMSHNNITSFLWSPCCDCC
jgi:hypothetical protein